MTAKVITVTFNPAYDLMGYCPLIRKGEVNLIGTIGMHPAGKGVNVAKVLKALDIDVSVSGFLGKENSDDFHQLFKTLSIDNYFQIVNGRTRVNVKLTEAGGAVTDFNFSGFHITPEDWQLFVDQSLNQLHQYDIVVVSGSLPLGITLKNFRQWMSELVSLAPCVIFDSSREVLDAGIKTLPWMIKPNRRELEIWAGYPLKNIEDIIIVAKNLCSMGIKHVVVSLGNQGALWVSASHIWLTKPPACQVVSTVGAGDALVGGLVYGVLNHEPPEEILRFATAIASLSVSQGHVGMIEHENLLEMKKRVTLLKLHH